MAICLRSVLQESVQNKSELHQSNQSISEVNLQIDHEYILDEKLKCFVLSLSVLHFLDFKKTEKSFCVFTGLCKSRKRLLELLNRCNPQPWA